MSVVRVSLSCWSIVPPERCGVFGGRVDDRRAIRGADHDQLARRAGVGKGTARIADNSKASPNSMNRNDDEEIT
jgi:hypothetical protein